MRRLHSCAECFSASCPRCRRALRGGGEEGEKEEEKEKEKEERLFIANAVNEKDSERDRATPV